MSRKVYSERERIFYDARRAAKAGQIVIAEFADGNREIVNTFRTRDGVQSVETMAGWSGHWQALLPFERVTDAMNALHEKKPARSQQA